MTIYSLDVLLLLTTIKLLLSWQQLSWEGPVIPIPQKRKLKLSQVQNSAQGPSREIWEWNQKLSSYLLHLHSQQHTRDQGFSGTQTWSLVQWGETHTQIAPTPGSKSCGGGPRELESGGKASNGGAAPTLGSWEPWGDCTRGKCLARPWGRDLYIGSNWNSS